MIAALIIAAYLGVGFTLGCFHYFRNGNKSVAAIAELVSIMLIWIVLGLIYIFADAHRTLHTAEGEKDA